MDSSKSDACGDLVVKFRITRLKDTLEPAYNDLSLKGLTTDGVSFAGTDTIRYFIESGKK